MKYLVRILKGSRCSVLLVFGILWEFHIALWRCSGELIWNLDDLALFNFAAYFVLNAFHFGKRETAGTRIATHSVCVLCSRRRMLLLGFIGGGRQLTVRFFNGDTQVGSCLLYCFYWPISPWEG